MDGLHGNDGIERIGEQRPPAFIQKAALMERCLISKLSQPRPAEFQHKRRKFEQMISRNWTASENIIGQKSRPAANLQYLCLYLGISDLLQLSRKSSEEL